MPADFADQFYDKLRVEAKNASTETEHWSFHPYLEMRFALICTLGPRSQRRYVYEGRLEPNGTPLLHPQRGCFYYLSALTLTLLGLVLGLIGAVQSAGSIAELVGHPKHLSFLFIGLALTLPLIYIIRRGSEQRYEEAWRLVRQARGEV
jgi:hypothetical protein